MKYRAIPLITENIKERFSSKYIVDGSGCWLWTAHIIDNGYGMFAFDSNHVMLAHRVSYTIANGQIPDGLQIDHLCRVRSCVNPVHLEAVTQKANQERGESGLRQRLKTHCPKGHEYTDNNIYRYGNQRHCRACKNNGRVPLTRRVLTP